MVAVSGNAEDPIAVRINQLREEVMADRVVINELKSFTKAMSDTGVKKDELENTKTQFSTTVTSLREEVKKDLDARWKEFNDVMDIQLDTYHEKTVAAFKNEQAAFSDATRMTYENTLGDRLKDHAEKERQIIAGMMDLRVRPLVTREEVTMLVGEQMGVYTRDTGEREDELAKLRSEFEQFKTGFRSQVTTQQQGMHILDTMLAMRRENAKEVARLYKHMQFQDEVLMHAVGEGLSGHNVNGSSSFTFTQLIGI